MTDAASELQRAIVAALTDDASLRAMLGGAKVFDHAPEHVRFPFVTLGRATATDWSTGTERGAEHAVSLDVWSRGGSKAEAYAIIERIRERLEAMHEALAGHRLVSLRALFSDVRREEGSSTFRGTLRLRAVTETPD